MGRPRHRRRLRFLLWIGVPSLILGAVVLIVVLHDAPGAKSRRVASSDSVAAFLAHYWEYPLQPEGKPPAGYSSLTASLAPSACGRCHTRQYREWRSSLHHTAMGPGMLWQFYLYGQRGANSCMRCHAPLAEQKALIARDFHWPNAPSGPPPSYVPSDLARQGLVCAACHVRAQRRYGPPPLPGRPAGDTPGLPHGGFTVSAAFRDSRFCASCHQFPADGPALDGVPFENTYQEWRRSRFAREGISCQDCHMPAGRHLWRGIHDPAMVRKAITVSLRVSRRGSRLVHVEAEIVNSGAGHDFPTYLVPRVTARLDLVTPAGKVARQLASRTIGRRVNLELTRQFSDTRIPPGGRLTFGADLPAPRDSGWRVRLRLAVAPEEWYVRMYEHYLAEGGHLPPAALPLLRQAVAQGHAERFVVNMATVSLPPLGAPAARVAN